MRRYILLAPLLFLTPALSPRTSAVQDKPPTAAEHIKKLLKDLQNFRDPKGRAEAAKQIYEVASELRGYVPGFINRATRDLDTEVRLQAARVVTVLGARDHAGDLLPGLADPNEDVRMAIVTAIGASAPFSRQAMPQLVELVKHKNPEMRMRAVGALGRFGSEARMAIPALVMALDDPDKGGPKRDTTVAVWARINLRYIDPDAERAGLALAAVRRADEAKVRADGFDPFGKDPPKPSQLLTVFVQVLKDKNYPELRAPAAHALGLLGPAAADAVPELIAALKAADIKDAAAALKARSAGAWALGQIGPQARGSLPELRGLLQNAAPEFRAELDAAIKRIAGEK